MTYIYFDHEYVVQFTGQDFNCGKLYKEYAAFKLSLVVIL
jgi:hypothetical protein